MDQPNQPQSRAKPSFGDHVLHFLKDLVALPAGHKWILIIAALAAGLGWSHMAMAPAASPALPGRSTSTTLPAPSAGNGFVATSNNNAPTGNTSTAPTPAPSQGVQSILASWARHMGSSVIVGYVVGWAFRVFLKVMSSITFVVVALFAGLSYFNIMNVDFTPVERDYTSTRSWVIAQGTHAKDAAMAHLGSPVGGAMGMFLGCRRRMRLPI